MYATRSRYLRRLPEARSRHRSELQGEYTPSPFRNLVFAHADQEGSSCRGACSSQQVLSNQFLVNLHSKRQNRAMRRPFHNV